jgi:regulation of enolase protein 1 (concanavalin A-like superfamily)
MSQCNTGKKCQLAFNDMKDHGCIKNMKLFALHALLYWLMVNSGQTDVRGSDELRGPSGIQPEQVQTEGNTELDKPVGLRPEPSDQVDGWGKFINPAGDCAFKNSSQSGVLKLIVPGSEIPHDLSPELLSMTAPRVLQTVEGDFSIQVKVIGDFEPGSDSTQAGRTGYNGAGLVVFADEKNFVRLERATLHRIGGRAEAYTNFEIRENGFLKQAGTTADFQTSDSKPTWLRLERRGNKMHGAMSQDGKTWIQANPMPLDPEFWNNGKSRVGVAAISTSRQNFTPVFSEYSVDVSIETDLSADTEE